MRAVLLLGTRTFTSGSRISPPGGEGVKLFFLDAEAQEVNLELNSKFSIRHNYDPLSNMTFACSWRDADKRVVG